MNKKHLVRLHNTSISELQKELNEVTCGIIRREQLVLQLESLCTAYASSAARHHADYFLQRIKLVEEKLGG